MYDHVANETIRKHLVAGWDQTCESMDQLCDAAADALLADMKNEAVSYELLQARQELFDQADLIWIDEGDGDSAMEFYRKFWSI